MFSLQPRGAVPYVEEPDDDFDSTMVMPHRSRSNSGEYKKKGESWVPKRVKQFVDFAKENEDYWSRTDRSRAEYLASRRRNNWKWQNDLEDYLGKKFYGDEYVTPEQWVEYHNRKAASTPTAKRPRTPNSDFTPKKEKPTPPVQKDFSNVKNTVGKSDLGSRMPLRRRRFGKRRFNRRRPRGGRGGGGGSGAVTFQRDAVNTYRAKRQSRFSRRRSKRYFKRAIGMQMRLAPNNIYRFSNNGVCGGTAIGTQGAIVIPCMYPFYGDLGRWDDMQVIMDSFGRTQNNQANVSGTQTTAARSLYNKIMFNKCTFDLDFTNTGSTACIVELYFIRSRTQGEPTSDPSDDFSIGDLRPTGLNDMSAQAVGGGATSQNQAQYISPFDSHRFCAKWKISSCKKLYLDPGKSSDIGFMNRRRKCLTGSSFQGVTANDTATWENNTTAILMIVTGAPINNSNAPVFGISQVSFTSQRTYNFKIMAGGLPMMSQV